MPNESMHDKNHKRREKKFKPRRQPYHLHAP